MDIPELFAHIERLKKSASAARESTSRLRGVQAQICEFLTQAAGSKSAFLSMAQNAGGSSGYHADVLISSLDNFQAHVQAGLQGEMSPMRRAQLDVVSDFLEQAQILLETKGVHPAAPIVLIGATLEEFLRTWVESLALSLGQRKPSLDSYAQTLFTNDLITKQDIKDLIAWAGLRNHAAHGEWGEVADKQRASLMLEGVNLFMRKYGAK